MLQEARKALEAMHKAANSLKMEQWGEAERALVEVQEQWKSAPAMSVLDRKADRGFGPRSTNRRDDRHL